MALPKQTEKRQELAQDDWSLTPEQMLFMMQNHNVIEAAFERDDLDFLRNFAASNDFVEIFGAMGFDEAYDRYESVLESGDAP